MNVSNGDMVTLSCFADGSPIQNVTWRLTDEVIGETLYSISYIIDDPVNRTGHIEYNNLTNDISEDFLVNKFTIAPPDVSVSSRLYGQLTIRNITPFEAGVYNCSLRNKFRENSATVPVRVQCEEYLLTLI